MRMRGCGYQKGTYQLLPYQILFHSLSIFSILFHILRSFSEINPGVLTSGGGEVSKGHPPIKKSDDAGPQRNSMEGGEFPNGAAIVSVYLD